MTEVVKHHSASATLPEKMQYAQALAASGMLPGQYRRQPANLLWALEFAESLGLHPMAAITGVHVIEGKPSASSGLISALVRKAGHKLRVKGDDSKAVAQIVRADDPEFTYEVTWTLDRAQNAGLCQIRDGRPVARSKKGEPLPWERFPAAMLKARAITEVAREACEEALSGMRYTPEELGAQVDAEGNPIDAEVQQLRPVPVRDFVAEARSAETADEVRGLWQEARDAGETEERLGWIASVGKSLAAESTPGSEAEAEPVDAEVVDETAVAAEAEVETAERELRAWAEEAQLPDIAADFESAKGVPLAQATAQQIRAFQSELAGPVAAAS